MSSSNCPNCGQPVTADDRFCSNCGARLEPAAAGYDSDEATFPEGTSQEPVIPTLGRKNAWEYERDNVRSSSVDDDEWRMSDPGPLPPRRRRTWLWIVIGLLALLVLACCIFMYWIGYTDGGQAWFEGIATEAAEIVEATSEAATPQS